MTALTQLVSIYRFHKLLLRWYKKHSILKVGRDSSVGIATRYGLDGPGIQSRWGRDFPHPSRPALGPTQSHTMGTGSSPRIKMPGRGVDHPTHVAPKLKKE
jgi:hypothetical protein